MELVLAVLVAGPIGYLTRNRRLALVRYLIAWAVVFPVQTIVVHQSGDLEPLYFAFNVPILAAGIALNRLGGKLAANRSARRLEVGVNGS